MRAHEAVGVHHCVRNALPSILGVLLASAIVLLGVHVIIDRALGNWTRRITGAAAPGEQASIELGTAAADFTRAALLTDGLRGRHRVEEAAEEMRLAAARYDRWVKDVHLDSIAPTGPAVARFEERALAAIRGANADSDIDAAGDELSALLRANSDAAAAGAQRALDQFTRVEIMGRFVHLGMMLTVAGICTGLLLAALRREELACAREAEIARRIDETNADLEAFAGRVAHDLRNPLVPILNGSQIIEHTAELPRIRETAERIERAARRLAGMIDTLLNFSRLSTARPGTTSDVCAAIAEVLEGFRERAEVEGVRLQVACEPIGAACEPIVLSSTLQNLVENAFKYGRRPGVEPVVEVRGRRRDGEVVIEVEDQGPGISPAEAETLFQPFHRGGQAGDGVGLGLATARRLVDARGGSITLRTGGAGGALFEVVLPEAPLGRGHARSALRHDQP